jgi:phosphoribosylamine--glycine ligase
VLTLTDSKGFSAMPAVHNHRALGEGDTGIQTEGLGAVSPVPWVPPEALIGIEHSIINPTLEGLSARGFPYQGVLFSRIIMPTFGPQVIEYRAGFGTPEIEVLVRLMKNDLLDLLEKCVDGGMTTNAFELEWGFAASITVAASADGVTAVAGTQVGGLKEASAMEGVVIFHDATFESALVQIAGWRVFGVTAVGGNLEDALRKAYAAADLIKFEGKYMRRDIGHSSIK